MDVVAVSRADAAFGYGSHGEIYEIADALPDRFWQHPHRAWSPLIRSTIPGLENVFLKYEGSHLSGSFKDRIMAASLAEMLAKSPDCPGVVVPSSGNAAVSAAAFAQVGNCQWWLSCPCWYRSKGCSLSLLVAESS